VTDKKTGSETTEAEVSDAESTAVELGASEPNAVVEDTEAPEPAEEVAAPAAEKRSIEWPRVLAYGILPGLALVLGLGAGYLKYQDNSVRDGDTARIESVQVAKDSTVALLSYKPDTVEQQLNDARGLLTGEFQAAYTDLTTNVVIPGAKEKQISAVATVPAAASVSADPNRAVVLVFVNQTVVVGADAPTDTASSVRVTLEKDGDRWLISGFDPV
jgi:Mce-associated membrane protein